MSGALVLIGHGSHLNGNSSAPIWDIAARLEAEGEFGEIRVGLWKEEPSLSRVLDGCQAGLVTVVPLFISAGYFTRTVAPREMGLDGPTTRRGGQIIRYTAPAGSHPALAEVISVRAREAGAGPQDAVVVLGHGTRRDSDSEKNIYRMADLVRASSEFAEVGAVFLDQEPGMLRMLDLFTAPRLVVVPLFMAEGWHVGQTIPGDLALTGAETRKGGRTVRYTAPAGTHPAMVDVVRAVAREHGADG